MPAEISPKRDPIVSIGRCSSRAAAVVTTSATKGPGTRWPMRGSSRGQ